MKKLLFTLNLFITFYISSSSNPATLEDSKIKDFKEYLRYYNSLKEEGKVRVYSNDKSWYYLSAKLDKICSNTKISQEDKNKCSDLFYEVMDIKN